ncbi:MAG: hypothetical protein WCF79_16520 [Rhodomicrobium sp.]
MPTKIIPGLLLFSFSTSVVLLLALASFQKSSTQSTSPSFSSQDVRLLSAEEINRRTLALAADMDDSAK